MRKLIVVAITITTSTSWTVAVASASSVSSAIPSVPCTFCTRGAITDPTKPFAIPGFDFIDSCDTVDQIVPDMLTESDPECAKLQSLSTYCGCPPPEDSCGLCPDGSPVAFPEKEVPWLRQAFDGIVPTCAVVEAHAASLSLDDEKCGLFQAISAHCGCPALPDHCTYCHGESLKEEFYDVELPFLNRKEYGFVGTCETYYLTQFRLPSGDPVCESSDFVTIHCGCNEGVLNYYGTSTTKEQEVLAWILRVSGSVSLVASFCILFDIAIAKRKKKATVYHSLILLIAVFDMITSVVFIVGPSVVVRDKETTGLPVGIYGAQGTSMTPCTVFGFLFHVGLTSVFLNVSLAIYFFMVIALGMRDATMHHYRLYLFAPPLAVGIGLSFAAIRFIGPSFSNCQVYTFPLSLYSWRLLTFFVVPIAAATIAILAVLVVIYCKVRLRARGCPNNVVSATPRLERQVFWQCLAYATAFGATWPIFMVAQYQGAKMSYPYGFWIFAMVLTPMQGLNNALCYFRPRFVISWRCKAQSATESKSSSPLPAGSDEKSDPVVELTNMAERQGSTGNNDSISSDEEMLDHGMLSSISTDY